MGIVERLRNLAKLIDFKIGSNLANEAADLIERLRGYAAHEPLCPCGGDYPLPDERCTCGLSALIKENEGD